MKNKTLIIVILAIVVLGGIIFFVKAKKKKNEKKKEAEFIASHSFAPGVDPHQEYLNFVKSGGK